MRKIVQAIGYANEGLLQRCMDKCACLLTLSRMSARRTRLPCSSFSAVSRKSVL